MSSAIELGSDGEEEDEESPESRSAVGNTFSLTLDMDDEDNDEFGNEDVKGVYRQRKKKLAIRYVMGDVTHPLDVNTDDNIIVHCAGKFVRSWILV